MHLKMNKSYFLKALSILKKIPLGRSRYPEAPDIFQAPIRTKYNMCTLLEFACLK